MPDLLSILGRQTDLCAAELAWVLARRGHAPRFHRAPAEVAWLGGCDGVDHAGLQDELGGTIKLAEVAPVAGDVLELLQALVDDYVSEEHTGGKLEFGVSVYRLDRGDEPRRSVLNDLRQAAEQAIKQHLRDKGVGARFVQPGRKDQSALSSAQVHNNGLVAGGLELVVAVDRTGAAQVAGRTRSVQSIETFVQQDEARSDERFKEGVLPQKLARMLVNLATTQQTRTVLDPFCGAGTIAGQVLLSGRVPVGGDNDPHAVAATQEYLENLRRNLSHVPQPDIRHLDARKLTRLFAPLSLDAAATEPWLGPPMRGRPGVARARELAAECRALYSEALAEVRTVLKPGARVVWIAPAWDCGRQQVPVDLAREFYLLGLTPLAPCAAWGNPARALTYHRRGQVVRRMIHILQNGPAGQIPAPSQ